jgi:hypothetical protein
VYFDYKIDDKTNAQIPEGEYDFSLKYNKKNNDPNSDMKINIMFKKNSQL